MPKKRKKHILKTTKKAIVLSIIAVVLIIAVLITNAFIPIKYLSAYISSTDKNRQGEMRVRFLDVGFGDCALVELPDGKNLLIDGGDGIYSHELSLLKTLNSSGIDVIDYLVCTSVFSEHCGGLEEILKYKKVKTVYAPYCTNASNFNEYSAFISRAERSAEVVKISEIGEGVTSEYGYTFTFLSPTTYTFSGGEYDLFNKNPTEQNARAASAVLWLEYAGRGIMFLSDATYGVQSAISVTYSLGGALYFNGRNIDITKCMAVKTACHGASGSVCEAFYDLISPEAAIISVGENGRSYPAEDVVLNLQNKCSLYRTDADGTICIKIGANGNYGLTKEK